MRGIRIRTYTARCYKLRSGRISHAPIGDSHWLYNKISDDKTQSDKVQSDNIVWSKFTCHTIWWGNIRDDAIGWAKIIEHTIPSDKIRWHQIRYAMVRYDRIRHDQILYDEIPWHRNIGSDQIISNNLRYDSRWYNQTRCIRVRHYTISLINTSNAADA